MARTCNWLSALLKWPEIEMAEFDFRDLKHKCMTQYLNLEYIYIYTDTHTHTYIHTHTYTYIYIYTHIHTYTYTCTYIHTYIHIRMCWTTQLSQTIFKLAKRVTVYIFFVNNKRNKTGNAKITKHWFVRETDMQHSVLWIGEILTSLWTTWKNMSVSLKSKNALIFYCWPTSPSTIAFECPHGYETMGLRCIVTELQSIPYWCQ